MKSLSVQPAYIPGLDGLRAVAVMFVMMVHSVPDFAPGGGVGVDIFFTLSGYLITSILIREFNEKGKLLLFRFYMRRVLRLAPALLLLVFAYLVLAQYFLPQPQTILARLMTAAAAISYTMNWVRAFDYGSGGLLGHTWSLSVEEQFYLVWPLILVALMRNVSPKVAALCTIAMAASSLIWRLYLDSQGATFARTYHGFDTRLDSILIGCSVAFMEKFSAINKDSGRLISMGWLIPFLAIGCVVFLPSRLGEIGEFASTIVALSTAAIIWAILKESQIISVVLSVGVFCVIGRISYGLYLWHYPIFSLLHLNGYSPAQTLMIGSVLSAAAASTSYIFIEQYFLRLKTRFEMKENFS